MHSPPRAPRWCWPCANRDKGERVLADIARRYRDAKAKVMILDLADLSSVREFADKANRALPQIDILLNNAGLGMQRTRVVTVDGFERQFATNLSASSR